MKTSRRTFLRVLGASAVGALVAPQIPLPVIESGPPSWWRSQVTAGSSPPLSLEMMREAFEKCTRGGGEHPSVIVTSQRVYQSYARMCGLVYDLDIAA